MRLLGLLASLSLVFAVAHEQRGNSCTLRPLGHGRDDTDQVLVAIAKCGKYGSTTFLPGNYNITRKMTWDLEHARVDLWGYLNFQPDIQYWLNANSTYRVVFIQSQASWFVLTGHDFTVSAHNAGGIQGNGQPWWNYYTAHVREDGDGRPIALTVFNASRASIEGFRIEAPPFWANCVAQSEDITYNGMYVNATNTNATFFNQNIVPNTDGIDTYRSNNINLYNWDVTCGDDCLAIKGNSTNVKVSNYTCRGGNGIAFGSLGQYYQFNDIVENVDMEYLNMVRINKTIQPNMGSGVYLKTWTGLVNGVPPTGGGGGGGYVKNVAARHVYLSEVDRPVHVYQTNGGNSSETPSQIRFSNLYFSDWSGTADTNRLVDIECSPAVPCPNMIFSKFNVQVPFNTSARYQCINVVNEVGLPAPCNATGMP